MIELVANIDVDDLDSAIEFYCAALDLQIQRRLFDDTVAELTGASSKIYLLLKPTGGSASAARRIPRNYRRHWTPVHLDFVVAGLEAAVERALAAGAKLEGAIQSDRWGRLATMSDPFGHGFCFIQFIGQGYDEMM